MEYRRLGNTGLKVSELCLGTMTFGWTTDEKNAYEVLNASFDAGINFIDSADIYSRWHPGNPGGVAETYIGNWMRGKPREQIIVATKVRGAMGDGPNDQGLSRGHILHAVEASLRRLRTDYIDLYQLHYPDDETPIEETLRALDDLVRQGKVRYIGVSNFQAWQLMKALWMSARHNLARFDCTQPHYNLVWRAEFEREMRDVCRTEGLAVIPYSPLQGGLLTGKYRRGAPMPRGARGEGNDRMTRFLNEERHLALLDAMAEMAKARGKTMAMLAIAWLLADPIVTSPIIGANTVAQLSESLGAVSARLSAEEKKKLDDLTVWQLE
ncbi:MAG: aldo/keto reductase [Chloroflexota bacterium]|nr:aldo/keto reductase [Chloroflexota bacterium]